MSDIIVLQGPTGTVHVADIGEIEEIFDLPAYRVDPNLNVVNNPVEEDAIYGTSYDPHRQITLRGLFEGRDWWPSERHGTFQRRLGRPPAHPTKQHK